MEFFYDLIFAVVLSSFAVNIAFGWPSGKWLNFVEMIMLLALWHDNVVYTNTFYAQDGLSMVLIFLQLLGVLGMTFFRNVVVNGGGSTFQGFVISFLWARFFAIVLFMSAAFRRTSPTSTRVAAFVYGFWIAVTCIPAAVTLGVSNSVTLYGRVMIWLVGAGLDHLVALILPFIPFWRKALPIANARHFRDRFGAVLLYLFGFMLFSLFFDESGPFSAGEWASISLFFLIAFCFMWMYYGDRHDDERFGSLHPLDREQMVWGHLWQALHMPLAGALIIMADASVQYVYYFRGIPRIPNTVVPVNTVNGPVLVLSNTVQWIYGVSFAVALGLVAIIGLLYQYETRQFSKRKIERTIGRFLLVIVMVLIPLGGLNNPASLNPIIQPIVGACVMFALVVLDWALTVALAPIIPKSTETVKVISPSHSEQIVQLEQRVSEQERAIASLQAQLQEARKVAEAAPAAAAAAAQVDKVSSELSSSNDWGFSSKTSSVVEDVAVEEEEASESHQTEEERVDMSVGAQQSTETRTATGSERPNADDGRRSSSEDD